MGSNYGVFIPFKCGVISGASGVISGVGGAIRNGSGVSRGASRNRGAM